MNQRLGILINTSRHPDYVRQLTRAACICRKQVHLHFRGDGLELAFLPSIAELGSLSGVVLTVDSALQGKRAVRSAGTGKPVIGLADFLAGCDRYVVF